MTRLYAATQAGVAHVDTGEGTLATWRTDAQVQCLAATPAAPERALVGTFESGCWWTTDAGETWARVGESMPDAVTSLAVSPHDPDVIWAGTEPSRVFRSDDGGATWAERPGLTDLPSADRWSFPPRPSTHHVRWIEPDPNEAGRLYVGIEAGALVRTEDGGETWQDHPAGARRDNHQLATHPDAPGRVYTAAGDGYAESRDAGGEWTYPQEGLDHRYCWSVAVDPGDPDRVLVSSARGARSAHSVGSADTYVYRRDGDDRWARVDGLPTGEGVLRAVLTPGSTAGECFALNNAGLYHTPDWGDSWERTDAEIPGEDVRPRGISVVAE